MKCTDEKYGPYGSEKVKIIDKCFQDILENISSAMCKMMLYSVDSVYLPRTREEFDRFKVYLLKYNS